MGRKFNIWDLSRMILCLRLAGFSTSQVESALRTDLHKKEDLDGNIVADPSDLEIINHAYSQPLQEAIHTKHGKNPSIFGYKDPNLKGGDSSE